MLCSFWGELDTDQFAAELEIGLSTRQWLKLIK